MKIYKLPEYGDSRFYKHFVYSKANDYENASLYSVTYEHVLTDWEGNVEGSSTNLNELANKLELGYYPEDTLQEEYLLSILIEYLQFGRRSQLCGVTSKS